MNTTPLGIVRAALLMGQLMLGVAAVVVTQDGGLATDDPGMLRTVRLIFAMTAMGVIALLFLIRRARKEAKTEEKQRTLCIAGWALGEGVGLFGGVYYLLSGDPSLFLAGLLVFGLSWRFLPLPDASPA